MQAFGTAAGRAMVLLQPNIDTDVIIRIDRLNELRMHPEGRKLLGRWAFESLRYAPDGTERANCVFNDPDFRNAPVLIAGPNFGCGSSREGAVWALMGLGIRCVVAESFGDIFYANCFQNGLLPVVLPGPEVTSLAEVAARGSIVSVDLEAQTISIENGRAASFAINASRRHAMLNGLDDIGQTMQHAAAIESWQASDQASRPWMWDGAA